MEVTRKTEITITYTDLIRMLPRECGVEDPVDGITVSSQVQDVGFTLKPGESFTISWTSTEGFKAVSMCAHLQR